MTMRPRFASGTPLVILFDCREAATRMNQPDPEHILQVGLGFWASKTLLSAVELGLFTELAKDSGDLEALQKRLGLHPRSALDFLDALVALKFLERLEGRYYNTPSTEFFLDRRKPSYLGGILEMANHRLYGFWGGLTEGLRTGRPLRIYDSSEPLHAGQSGCFRRQIHDRADSRGPATTTTCVRAGIRGGPDAAWARRGEPG